MQFVLAFLYAPEAAMGLDENMTCIWDGQETTMPQYLITVCSADYPHAVKQYQTIRLSGYSLRSAQRLSRAAVLVCGN